MKNPDLRILALADAKILPPDVQAQFDHWRIWKARDAVVTAVRKRLLNAAVPVIPILQTYLDRLREADSETTIFEGIYALAEVVEVYRQQLGLHSEYIVLIMSGQLNPWGLLAFQQDFEHPAVSVVWAARELWRLANEQHVNVKELLAQVKRDETLAALEQYYTAHAPGAEPVHETETPRPADGEAKTRLTRLLDEAHKATMEAARALDADTVVFEESSWRVKDLIGHLAAWESESVTSLRAFLDGKEYQVSDSGHTSDDAFNQEAFKKRQDVAAEPIYQEWAEARNRLKTALGEVPPEKFESQMLCPWGTRGTVAHLIEELVAHEREHRDSLLKKAEPSTSNENK
jgi:hypothetical protein